MIPRQHSCLAQWLCAILSLGVLYFGVVAGVHAEDATKHHLAQYGADANPTGNPIGGGLGYTDVFTSGGYLVTTSAELLQALTAAKAGEVIYIAPDAQIDLTGQVGLVVRAGVTLAGNRGVDGSLGPLIYCDEYHTIGLFVLMDGARFTGLRLQGPDPDTAVGKPNSRAITVFASNVEIDNNEIYHWSSAGIGIDNYANNVYIHHNYIHHVRRSGLGYPIVVNQGYALIEANIFDYYRHAIAGTGFIGSGYEARYNVIRDNATSHAFDMHGGADFCANRSTCTFTEQLMGGEYLLIHHNTFEVLYVPAIVVRGIPRQTTQIHHNWFYTPEIENGVSFLNYSGGNTEVYANAYGPNKQVVDEQVTPSLFIHKGSQVTDPIVATAQDALPVVFQIHSPHASQVVSGTVAVDFATTIERVMEIVKVEILLANQLLYSAGALPKPQQVSMDTTQLADGPYTLSFVITNKTDHVLTQSVQFTVRNWWTLNDDMLPPLIGGFFGTLDRSITMATSKGWQYVTDDAANFFGDDSRRVSTTENAWLIWETPNLIQVEFLVYSRNRDTAGISLSASADQSAWAELAVTQTRSDTPSADGWYHYQVKGVVPQGMVAHYLRLQVNAGFSTAVHVGRMESQGKN